MGFSLLPRADDFFVLFDRMTAKMVEVAHRFRELLENYTDVQQKSKLIKELEREADLITHEVMDRLNKSFITPLDREDIRSLALYLDTVVDDIEAAASKFDLFDLKKPTPSATEMARIICRATEEIQKAVKHLEAPRSQTQFLIEIKRLENQADQICRTELAKLFREEPDVRELLKWKEIYEHLESCADRCEDVADVIEDIVVKNA